MFRKHIIIISTLYFFTNISLCFAQNSDLNQRQQDSLEVIKLLDLSMHYYYNEHNLDSMLHFTKKALLISKSKKIDYLTTRSYSGVAIAYLTKNEFNNAKKNIDSALIYANKTNDNNIIIRSFILKGGYYEGIKEFDTAIKTYLKALKIADDANNSISKADIYYRISSLYTKMNNVSKVKEFLDKTSTIIKKYPDKVPPHIQMGVLENNAFYFEKQSLKHPENKALKDSLIKYYNYGLEFATKNKVLQKQGGMHAFMAMYYLNKDMFKEAEPYCKKALQYKTYLDAVSLNLIYSALPHIALYNQEDSKAIKYIDTLLNHIPMHSIKDSINAYHVAYEVNFALRNYEDAQKYNSLKKKLKDSLYNKELEKIVEELQIKYDTEKKDAQIIAQQLEKKDIENKARVNYLLFGFAFLSLLIIATIFYFKNKNKNLQTKLDLEQTKAALFRSELNPNFKPNPQKSTNSKILIKSQDVSELLNINDIIRCEADGTYAKIITTTKTLLSSKNLKYYENILASHDFIRVHNSHLVNVDYIQTFNRQIQDGLQLRNGDKIPVSARKKKAITDFLDALS
ncbi:LytTR family transcriptional regulator DNA-binding domain-containing protein [Psychroserpens sp. MEBiC05023]